VAEEMGVRLGEEVGYTIRFEDATSTVRLLYIVLIFALSHVGRFPFDKSISICKGGFMH
jgi:hypothetical protein